MTTDPNQPRLQAVDADGTILATAEQLPDPNSWHVQRASSRGDGIVCSREKAARYLLTEVAKATKTREVPDDH